MSSSPELCPVNHREQKEEKAEMLPLKDGEIDRAAQGLLDGSEYSVEMLIDLEHELRARWALGLKLNPEETEHKIARTLRKVTFAAMSTITYTHLLHQLTPSLEADDRLDTPLSREPTFTHSFIPVQHGSAAHYTSSMYNKLMTSSNEVFDSIIDDPSHPRHNLWVAFEGAHAFMSYTTPYRTFSKDVRKSWGETMVDGARVTLETLLNLGHSHTILSENFPTKHELMRKAVQNIDTLSWPATTNISMARRLFFGDTLAEDFADKYEGARLVNTSEFMPEREPLLVSSHIDPRDYRLRQSSLNDGPWRKAGFCPAVPILQMQSPEDRQIVERFFQYFENRFNHKIMRVKNEHGEGEGHFDRATVALLIGVLYAGETVFANWPTANRQFSQAAAATSSTS